jgi:hypothetical protein
MAHDKDDENPNTLEAHQKQCDSKYITWIWGAAIMATLALGGFGAGWATNRSIAESTKELEAVTNSLTLKSAETAFLDARQQEDIDAIKRRMAYMDTVAIWLPRAMKTLDEIHTMVQSKRY